MSLARKLRPHIIGEKSLKSKFGFSVKIKESEVSDNAEGNRNRPGDNKFVRSGHGGR